MATAPDAGEKGSVLLGGPVASSSAPKVGEGNANQCTEKRWKRYFVASRKRKSPSWMRRGYIRVIAAECAKNASGKHTLAAAAVGLAAGQQGRRPENRATLIDQ